MERLEPAVALMQRATERFGGMLIHALGDGIVVLFGAPRAQEGHALLACRAALAIRDAFALTPQGLRVRQGLHSGLILLATRPADRLGDAGIHGVAIHIASRLQLLADPGEIYVSRSCYDLVHNVCDGEALGAQMLRGVPEAVEVFRLTGFRAVAAQRFLGQRLTTLQGREHELRALRSALHGVDAGKPGIIGVSGHPGSGKSRLFFEFARWCRDRSIPVFEARAQIYGETTPLQPILDLLRLLLRLPVGLEPAAARERVAAVLSELGITDRGTSSLVDRFLGLSSCAPPDTQAAPASSRTQLLTFFTSVASHAGRRRIVVIIEDLHWLDEASLEFVNALCETVVDSRILLLLNYRPGYAGRWMEHPYAKLLNLSELDAAQMAALVDELAGNRPDLRDLRERIIERSGGNPFFAEELVRSLAEGGVLTGARGDHEPGGRADDHPLPATVQAVIADRIDRLPADQRHVLQMASVLGKDVPLAILEAVAEHPSQDLRTTFARLCASGFLHETDPRSAEFAFRHPLIREVAYAGQIKARRRSIHASIARAMKTHYADRIDELAGLICFHFEAAGEIEDAAAYAVRAAEWVGSMHPAQAIGRWHDARRLVRQLPRSASSDALRVMANAQIAWLGWREGMTAEPAQPYIEEALFIAREGQRAMIPLLLFAGARIQGASGGRADDYVSAVHRALDLVRREADLGRAATLYASLAQGYGWAGLLREGLAASDQALERLPFVQPFEHRFLGYSVEHWTLSLRARLLIKLNRLAEGRAGLEAMISVGEGLIDPTVAFISHLGFVDLSWILKDPDLAGRHATRVAALADRYRTPYLRVFASACSGTAKAISGLHDDAIRDLRDGLGILRSTRAGMEYEPDLLATLAECEARAARYEAAIVTAGEAIEIAQARSARLPECRASLIAGITLAVQSGGTVTDASRTLFATADRLMVRTGAAFLAPMLEAGRSGRLREALG